MIRSSPMGDTIRAVVQTGPRQLAMREFPRPVIGPDGGGLLRVEACGICGSDVEQYRGNLSSQWLPMVPGHDRQPLAADRKSTRLNSSHSQISYAVFCLKKKNNCTRPA